jgi:hypothetical protein
MAAPWLQIFQACCARITRAQECTNFSRLCSSVNGNGPWVIGVEGSTDGSAQWARNHGTEASEEPELCVRLRAAGWRIHRINAEMTVNDAAMTRMGQWWRRTVRTGYGFAQGAQLHGAPPEKLWVWESRRAWVWAVLVPFACLVSGAAFGSWGWASWLIYPLQILRQTARKSRPPPAARSIGMFQLLDASQRFGGRSSSCVRGSHRV